MALQAISRTGETCVVASLPRVELEQLRFGTSAAESAARDMRDGTRCRPSSARRRQLYRLLSVPPLTSAWGGRRVPRPHLSAHNRALCL
jgi:hypothetical protein